MAVKQLKKKNQIYRQGFNRPSGTIHRKRCKLKEGNKMDKCEYCGEMSFGRLCVYCNRYKSKMHIRNQILDTLKSKIGAAYDKYWEEEIIDTEKLYSGDDIVIIDFQHTSISVVRLNDIIGMSELPISILNPQEKIYHLKTLNGTDNRQLLKVEKINDIRAIYPHEKCPECNSRSIVIVDDKSLHCQGYSSNHEDVTEFYECEDCDFAWPKV